MSPYLLSHIPVIKSSLLFSVVGKANPNKALPPLKAIRKYCLLCCNSQPKEVRLCSATECPLHLLRFGKGQKGLSSLKSIRSRCIDCSGGSLKEVRECGKQSCPLHPFRMGKNLDLKGKRGKGNPEALRRYREKIAKSKNYGAILGHSDSGLYKSPDPDVHDDLSVLYNRKTLRSGVSDSQRSSGNES